jgi:N-acetylglucosamine-6-sulfatase
LGKYLNGYHADRGYVPHGWTDWDATAEAYHEFDYVLNDDGHPVFYGNRPQDYLTDVIASRGADFIDSARSRPFFLELATFAPHRPAVPLPRDLGRYPYARAPRNAAFNRPVGDPPRWLAGRRPLVRAQLARIDFAYRRRARCMVAVNRMLTLIERR